MSNVLVIGGSRNIGYYSALRLLAAGSTVTFLLRSPSVFDGDAKVQEYVKSGKAFLVQGDALKQSDVQSVWDEASKHGSVDVVLFTVGGTPKFHPLKGFVITPENLVTQCFLNLICIVPHTATPKIVAISSTGLTHESHASLPLLLKPLYGYLLAVPHKDKMGMERVIAYCAGWDWNTKDDGEPSEKIMGSAWREREGLPAAGSVKNIMVVRPALLTDGACRADGSDKPAYRVSDKEIQGGYTVSRKDVAHFVVDAVSNRWNDFADKTITIVY
ncbi:uncharacterized protein BT62DRAFT_973755 [Guyanagaster necrorhizus]|uniref:NAD(P)-binding domain-containing protein n=1 Tax=Guyanagaster necrorhizus TaxID=856835 RepID=A0A9P7VMA5_9AGAR|nr:uncharacterized protein BT62DRAFT_973755 [Guyanagaster necrorhizus MCA 3950]KAG7442514.1 hypothetical protein BT62DRAFT_973755 [Guyanagaster necrorhizus MCA 3950]